MVYNFTPTNDARTISRNCCTLFTTLRHVGLVQTWPLVIYLVVIDNLKDTLNNSCKENVIGSE